MNCPKCNKEIPYDHNLCGYCGNPIREKCLECGEMELIGRVVCEKAFVEADKVKKRFVSEKIKKLPDIFSGLSTVHSFAIALVAAIAIMMMLAGVLLLPQEISWLLIIGAIAVGIMCLVAFKYSNKYFQGNIDKMKADEERATQEFFHLPEFAEYAEIIKKAEGEKK